MTPEKQKRWSWIEFLFHIRKTALLKKKRVPTCTWFSAEVRKENDSLESCNTGWVDVLNPLYSRNLYFYRDKNFHVRYLWCYKSSETSINRGILDAVSLVNATLRSVVCLRLGLAGFPSLFANALCSILDSASVFISKYIH